MDSLREKKNFMHLVTNSFDLGYNFGEGAQLFGEGALTKETF